MEKNFKLKGMDNTDKLGSEGFARGCPERYVLSDVKQEFPPYVSDSNGATWLTKEQLQAMSCQ